MKITVAAADLAYADLDGVKGFQIFSGSLFTTVITGSNGQVAGSQVSEFTSYDGTNVNFIVTASAFTDPLSTIVNYQVQPQDNARGDFEAGNATPNDTPKAPDNNSGRYSGVCCLSLPSSI